MTCHPRATCHVGVRIPSAILKIVFRRILFFSYCSLGFDERRLSYRLRYTCFYCRIRPEGLLCNADRDLLARAKLLVFINHPSLANACHIALCDDVCLSVCSFVICNF